MENALHHSDLSSAPQQWGGRYIVRLLVRGQLIRRALRIFYHPPTYSSRRCIVRSIIHPTVDALTNSSKLNYLPDYSCQLTYNYAIEK